MRRWLCALAILIGGAQPAAACVGDCGGDGSVTVDELILGVSAALGTADIDACRAFDRDVSGDITVDELLEGVTNALTGCPRPSPSATATPSPTSTPSPDSTATASPSVTINLPPLGPTPFIYRGFVGRGIDLPLGVVDPEGEALSFSALDLPDGAFLDAETGQFHWTPQLDQLGTFYVPWSAQDAGIPPAGLEGRLTFQIEPQDECQVIECDPALGCRSNVVSVSESCCSGVTPVHLGEPVVDCPDGRLMIAGANRNGFGRLSNCDQFEVTNRAQSAADILLHVAARCFDTSLRVTVRARLDMDRPGQGPTVLVDDEVRVNLTPEVDGYAVKRGLRYGLSPNVIGPFFDFQGAEANLYVEVSQGEQLLSESIRVRLTFTAIPDLIDPTPVPTPTPLL